MSTHADALLNMGDEALALRICEGSCLWQLNRVTEAVDRLEQVRTELLAKADSHSLALCNYQLAAAESTRGNHELARVRALEALVSARRAGSAQVEASAQYVLSMQERFKCRWAAAVEAARECALIAQRAGMSALSHQGTRAEVIVLWKQGLLELAAQRSSELVEDLRSEPNERPARYVMLLKGMILLHAGKYDEARKLFTSGENWDVPEATSRPSLLTTEFLGDIHLEQENGAAALPLYDEVLPKAMALVPKGDIVAELRRRRAECYYLLNRMDEAYTEAMTGLEHCRELGDRYEEAATYRVLALSAAALGNPGEAKKHFDQGFAYYDDIETPFEWGKLWMSYGDWLCGAHAGDYADLAGAMQAYRAAEHHFSGMGAMAKLEMANKRIEALRSRVSAEGQMPSSTAEFPDTVADRRESRRPRRESESDRRAQWALENFGLVTRNRAILDQLDDVAKLAVSGAPILVLGESGTGKELIAAGIHRLSGRKGRYMPLNIALVAKEMFESELFGHVAGSFTGATRDKPGLFEVSDQGTVFLDEIAEMPLELQSRLLRFLETGESRRVGATQATRVNTRVIAATNRDRAAMERGDGFRTDLYYRLAHAVFVLPPLRQRGDDVELLLNHFLDYFCAEERKRVRLSSDARERMLAYSWPGNVRQMRSVVHRLVLLAAEGTEIREGHLQLSEVTRPSTLTEELEHAERGRIATALDLHRGSRTETARALGMKRTTLLNKMRRYGLR
jgi:DNA-binding NtrC family response regulator/tetratricopeptide (TPR) repeat protein